MSLDISMGKSVYKSEFQTVIDLIDQISTGRYDQIEIPQGLEGDYQIIVQKLNQLGLALKDRSEIDRKSTDTSFEADDRYRILVESAPFCIHEIDLNGNIVSMNPSGLKMLGANSQKDVCGTAYLDYVDPPQKIKVKSLMKKAFKGTPSIFEFTSRQGNITTVFHSNFVPIWPNTKKNREKTVISKIMGITQDITESVQTKDALQRSREDLKMVIDNIDEIVYAIEFTHTKPNAGNITYLSPQVKKILGYSTREFIKDPDLWYSLIHPEDVAGVRASTKELHSNKRTITRYYRLKHKNSNEYVWFDDKVTPQINSKGVVFGYIGGARDITSRKVTEQALKNSEEKYRAFFEKAPIGIGLADHNGNLLAFNNAILKPGKYSKEDAKSIRNVREFYYDNESRKSIIQELKTRGHIDQKEILFKRKDGSPYSASLSLTPLTLDGKPFIMALVQDISQKKEIGEALKESEERNKTIVENVQEAIVIFEDGMKEFIDFNQNAVKLFGYSSKELKKMTPAQLSPEFQPDGRTSVIASDEVIAKALNGKKQLFEWVHRDKKGREFPCEVHLTRIPYRNQVAVMGSVVDISERKRVELERENLIKELDRFVYSASHDLSAPLKSILGLLNIIRLEPNALEVSSYMDKMEQSIYKLEDFIKEIIQYSRNTRLDVKTEKVELKPVVEEIIRDLKYSEGFSEIDFTIDFKDLPLVVTDRFRLQIVLNNLISNSIKFHKKIYRKKPFVKIRGRVTAKKWIIEVIDNGQGIKEENVDNIFDMFYRGSNTAPGSGLGLYIAKEATQNINGELSVKSKYGKGSTFSLAFEKVSI